MSNLSNIGSIESPHSPNKKCQNSDVLMEKEQLANKSPSDHKNHFPWPKCNNFVSIAIAFTFNDRLLTNILSEIQIRFSV